MAPLPLEMWHLIIHHTRSSGHAAHAAFVCQTAFHAYKTSPRWSRSVRIAPTSRRVLPPLAGHDVEVAPGECLQAAINACPQGGSVLMRPGVHAGTFELHLHRVVHVFGAGQAILRAPESKGASVSALVASNATASTLDGIVFVDPHAKCSKALVLVRGGSLRVQACDLVAAEGTCIRIATGTPVIERCTMRDSAIGVDVLGGRNSVIADNTITGMSKGIQVVHLARTTLDGNRIVRNEYGAFLWSAATFAEGPRPNVMTDNARENFAGEGWREHMHRIDHAARQPELAAADAILRARLDTYFMPEPVAFDRVLEPDLTFQYRALMTLRKGSTVLLRPGLYELSTGRLIELNARGVRFYGRGLVTWRMLPNCCILASDTVFDGIRFVTTPAPRPPTPTDWSTLDDDHWANVQVRGRAIFQACVFDCAFTCIGVAATGVAKVLACKFSSGSLCGIAFNVPLQPSSNDQDDTTAQPHCVRGCEFGNAVGACIRVQPGRVVRLEKNAVGAGHEGILVCKGAKPYLEIPYA